jgi:UDP-N-acetylmuramyl pentapeptide phosphotransferase/UDP-N-acetylglucosamine-1-phosphate transferase
MTIKLGIITSLAFIYLGIKAESAPVIFISTSTTGALIAFYFYNREPAKIYMGEIGGSVVGFLFYAQAALAYQDLTHFGNAYKSISWVIIACSLPLCELGISFLRRLAMNKSPFRGDKLHLHHILKAKYKLSASRTSTVMALFYGTTFFTSYLVGKYTTPQIGASLSIITIVSFYLKICYKDWIATKNPRQFENLFLHFEDKTVHVIDSDLLNNLTVEVVRTNEIEKRRINKEAS